MAEKKSSFIIILRSMIMHRGLIIVNVFAVTVAAIVISMLLPEWFRATVVVLPPEKSESLSEIALSMGKQSMALTAGAGFALPVMASPSDLLATIAKSRTVAERVTDSLNLVEKFESSSRESAVGQLRDKMSVHVKAEGIIEISYESKDRQLAAKVANSIAKELDEINRLHNTQKARDLKDFIEEELKKNRRNLSTAEEALQEFQRKHKAISLDDQTSASIQAAADLYSQLTLDQINLKVLENTHSANHPDIITLKYKISEIGKKLTQLQEGSAQPADSAGAFLAIPFSDLPELSIRYLQLLRELKKEETLNEALSAQYEQANIMEAKDTPTISVLDWAVPPIAKFKPRRAYIVLTAMILSFFVTLIFSILFDKWREFKTSRSESYRDISVLMGLLRRDFFGFKRKKVE